MRNLRVLRVLPVFLLLVPAAKAQQTISVVPGSATQAETTQSMEETNPVDPPAAEVLAEQETTAATETAAETLATQQAISARIWMRVESEGQPPGSIVNFLANGTLLWDSCWETYSLFAWEMTDQKTLAWTENGAEVLGEVVSVNEDTLHLKLTLARGEQQDLRFVAATVPFTCPDLPR